METFLLKVLSCPPNQQLFLKILERELGLSNFKTLSLELPLLQEEDYGFIDVFGLTEVSSDIEYIFIEAKWKFPGAQNQAKEELKEYSYSYSKYGLLSDDMTRLYHQTVFDKNSHAYDTNRKSAFLPMIIDSALVESISNQKIETVISNCSNFIAHRIYQRIPALESITNTLLNENLVPRYPNFVVRNGETKLIMYCYDFCGNPVTREVSWSEAELRDRIPTKEMTELNNNQVFDVLSNMQGEKAFVMHYSLNGYHRPNLFLETEKGKFLCLQHMGLRGLNYMGTYDEKAAFDYEDSLIYSTVLVDRGKYWVTKADNQVINTQFVGKRFHGSLRLSFGASISFRTKFIFEKSGASLTRL